MTIKEMHYDFKKKLNKIDSQQYRNLRIPEIDWTLQEAEEIFKKMIVMPRKKSHLGFEVNQRTIDDIRTLVVRPESDPNASIDVVNNLITLPTNYWHFIKAEVETSKGTCTGIKAKLYIKQHDDEFELSPFDKSSFEWRVVNGVFYDKGIQLFDDKTFINTKVHLTYVRQSKKMHNAEDYRNGEYKQLDGTKLTGSQNCELPEHTHREIVDIAVLLASEEAQNPDYQNKLQKLNMNQIN